MGVFGFVMSGGGAVGALLGGVLTGLLNWHAIFWVNVPVGITVWVLARRILPADEAGTERPRLDLAGAALVTVSTMLATYAVVGGNDAGWTSGRTLGLLGTAVALLVAFVAWESRTAQPLVPLRLFRLRNVTVSQVVGVLWSGAMMSWFFLATLYMQLVLGYDALTIGIAFLPTSVVMAFCSLKVSDRLVMRLGIRAPLVAGLLLAAGSLALLSRAPVGGSFLTDLLPAMLLMGVGAGIAFNPVLLAAMGDVEPHESGLASGVVNTSFMLGGALGLAVFVSLSSGRTAARIAAGSDRVAALDAGFQLAFAVGAVAALGAAVVGGTLLRPQPMPSYDELPAEACPEPV
jgi:MFS family permease